MTLMITPVLAFASQGGGTGADSLGGDVRMSSQGGGTGADSISRGIYVQSQGGGTGSKAIGSEITGSRTDGSSYFSGARTGRVLQQKVDRLLCSFGLRCLYNSGR